MIAEEVVREAAVGEVVVVGEEVKKAEEEDSRDKGNMHESSSALMELNYKFILHTISKKQG